MGSESDPLDSILGAPVEPERQPAVVNGVWVQSSVSQLKTASMCLLKWHHNKVQGLAGKPPSKGMRIGTKGHEEIEFYLKGQGTVLGPLARAGLRFLPQPGLGLLIERRFDGQPRAWPFNPATAVLKAGGVPLDGYIDVVNERALRGGYELPGTGTRLDEGTLIVTDHKFSKNIDPRDDDGYAALEEDLADVEFEHGIQMIGYAEWARLALLPQIDFNRVVLQHIYYNNGLARATPEARSVWTIVDLETVEREWFKVNSLARSAVDVAKETDILKVPYNEASCGAYGGCDFANICPRSPLNRYTNLEPSTQEDTMSILNNILGAQAPAAPVTAQPLPPPPTPVPVIPPQAIISVPGWTTADKAQPGQAYFIQALGKAVKYLGTGPDGTPYFENNGAPVPMHATTQVFLMAPPPVAPVAIPGTAVVGVGADGRPLPAVLPPDAPVSNPLTSAEPTKVEAVAEEKPKKAKKAKGFVIIDQSTPEEQEIPLTPSVTAPVEAVQVTTPALLGSVPAGVFDGPAKPSVIEVKATTNTTEPAPDANTRFAPAPTGLAATKLFINCRPDSGSTRLDDYINELVGKLCAHYKVKDPRITPTDGTGQKDKNHPLAFDGWKGRLSAVVAVQPPPPGNYHFSGHSDFADIIIPALAALLPAENVVRAS